LAWAKKKQNIVRTEKNTKGENVKNNNIQINALNKCVGDRNCQSIDNAIR